MQKRFLPQKWHDKQSVVDGALRKDWFVVMLLADKAGQISPWRRSA